MRQIILDTETTGLNPEQGHRIIEIGCIELIDRQFTGNNYHQYINPGRDVEAEALEVHGISEAFLADKPFFQEIYQDFIAYIDGAELVIHNAVFDVNFLDHEFKWLRKGIGKVENYCQVLDTLMLARELHPGQRNSLDALCKRYHVDNSNRDLHGALLDANLLALVYLAMTGGQGALFAEQEDGSEQCVGANEHGVMAQLSSIELPVIAATQAELDTHQEYLEWIAKQNGESALWMKE